MALEMRCAPRALRRRSPPTRWRVGVNFSEPAGDREPRTRRGREAGWTSAGVLPLTGESVLDGDRGMLRYPWSSTRQALDRASLPVGVHAAGPRLLPDPRALTPSILRRSSMLTATLEAGELPEQEHHGNVAADVELPGRCQCEEGKPSRVLCDASGPRWLSSRSRLITASSWPLGSAFRVSR